MPWEKSRLGHIQITSSVIHIKNGRRERERKDKVESDESERENDGLLLLDAPHHHTIDHALFYRFALIVLFPSSFFLTFFAAIIWHFNPNRTFMHTRVCLYTKKGARLDGLAGWVEKKDGDESH